jgi:hypothetical protein
MKKILLGIVLLISSSAFSQWLQNGTPVSVSGGSQGYPQMVFDKQGSAIICWQTCDLNSNIYAQKIDGYGYRDWGGTGIAICEANGKQEQPKMAMTTDSCIVITWQDERNGNNDIYAQKISQNGELLWPLNGMPVCTLQTEQLSPSIVPSSSGGCVLFWPDQRSVPSSFYAQALNTDGSIKWGSNGVFIGSGTNITDGYGVSDDTSGVIVVWRDQRNGSTSDLFIQRIDSMGVARWDSNGYGLCDAPNNQYPVSITKNKSGAIRIAWIDLRNSIWDIYSQQIDATGNIAWGYNGKPICVNAQNKYLNQMVQLTEEYAIATWTETRAGMQNVINQKIDSHGAVVWLPEGRSICSHTAYMPNQKILSNDSMGYLIVWGDTRNTGYTDLYCQKVNIDGETQWQQNGIPINLMPGDQLEQQIVTDGINGAFISWQSAGGADYVQRIDKWDGNWWGKNAPQINAVKDISNDQGGFVTVTWRRSVRDTLGDTILRHYSVWHSTTGNINNPSSYNWSWVADIPVNRDSIYSIADSTQQDSIGPTHDSINFQYYKVIVHTIDSAVNWCSLYDSGYSVDNIPPDSIKGLSGMNMGGGRLLIEWGKNTEPDFSHYTVYRASDSLFVLHDTLLIGTTTDTSFIDNSYLYGYYYKLTAVDIHNNRSVPIRLRSITGVAGEPEKIKIGTFLIGNVMPNPTRGDISLQYRFEKPERITAKIYNAIGQLVMIKPKIKANSFSGIIECDVRRCSDGVYYLKIDTGGKTVLRKYTLIK